MDMTLDEMIERIKLFLNTKQYTFLKTRFGYFHNGYIIKLYEQEDKILFADKKIGEIPILISDIVIITLSRGNKGEGELK